LKKGPREKRGLAPFPPEEVFKNADPCVMSGCNIYIPYKIKQIFLDIKNYMFYIVRKTEKKEGK